MFKLNSNLKLIPCIPRYPSAFRWLLLDENYLLGLWVIADNEILGNNYNKAEELLNRILIQLSEGTEEYNLVLRKLNELQN